MNLVYTAGRWQLDILRRELRADGHVVPIGMRAFEIIEVLVRSAGSVVAKDVLMRTVWPGAVVEEATLWVHISAIRRALGADRNMLGTVSRRGYRLMGNWTATPHDASQGDIGAGDAGAGEVGTGATEPATNIPQTPLSLIGRGAAIQTLLDLSSAYRAITLTGPGGIGKTVLALEVARRLLPRFTGGGWFVDLSSLSDGPLLASAVAATIGLRMGGETITPHSVGRTIGQARLVLVLDNCEHVIEAASSLADSIARLCPHVLVLSTSRETLQIGGEYVYRVPPLPTPPGGKQSSDTFLEYGAVELFIARTEVLRSDFAPDNAALSRIASICRRLDGIPLAIEFASACAASIGLQAVEDRLADRFGLLAGGRRTAPPRHQTLAATLEWSYQLLPEQERLILRHLAVFRGGFTLDAAISVVGSKLAASSDAVPGIRNLVTKSLLATEGPSAGGRFWLLETTRAYAARELDTNGEAQTARESQARYFLDLLAPGPAGSQAARSTAAIVDYSREIDNVRAALEWAFSPAGDVSIGIALTSRYAQVWLYLSLLREAMERVEAALANLDARPDTPLVVRMNLQIALGLALIFLMGPMTRIGPAITSALRAARKLNDEVTELQALWALWILDTGIEDVRAGQRRVEQFERLARRVGDPSLAAFTDRLAGYTCHLAGEHADAARRFRRAIDAPRFATAQRYTILDFDHRAVSRAGLAVTLCLQGFLEQAVVESGTSLREAIATGHPVSTFETIRLAAFPIAVFTLDFAAASRAIAMLEDFATDQNGTYWIILGQFLKGELAVKRGEFAKGVGLFRNAFDRCKENGWASRHSQFLAVFAEALAGLGHLNEAISTIDMALARAKRGGELVYAPEILRIKGEVILKANAVGCAPAAERCFLEAIDMARQQGALLWELRATLGLARLRVKHERRSEARSELSLIYNQFTEGFEAGDLRAARTALRELDGDEPEVGVRSATGRGRRRA